jgi:hypothetical protein
MFREYQYDGAARSQGPLTPILVSEFSRDDHTLAKNLLRSCHAGSLLAIG